MYADAHSRILSTQEMIIRTYHINSLMPNHIFFDDNCTLGRMVKDNPIFKNVGLTVDVFHFTCKQSVRPQSLHVRVGDAMADVE
jgi:hypothetical protein